MSGGESPERIMLTPSEYFRVIEERRRAAEGVLWQLPNINLVAQAFLLSAGLSPDVASSSQIVVGALGIAAVIGVGLVVIYQATRANIFGGWVDETVCQPLRPEDIATQKLRYNGKKIRRVEWVFWVFYAVCVGSLLAFLLADGFVLGQGLGLW
jgi:hypothetical protein